jgi:hypothetical protein
VFRDSVQVGPDLDVVFHAVVPDTVTVLGADLHLYGTQGVLPVSTDSAPAGTHNHSLTSTGLHAHGLSLSEGHNHTHAPSGDHAHNVVVYNTGFSVNDARMTADMPTHTHTFDGFTRIVDPYDFAPLTSNGHNHTSPGHGHDTVIAQSGDHQHATDAGGDHSHDVPITGDHGHASDIVGDHGHTLSPGTSAVMDGVRPSGVEISITVGTSTDTLTGTHGDPDADWNSTVVLDGRVGTGVTTFTMTSQSHGSLEYVLVVEVDEPYGAITGQGALGPGGELEIPIWAPASTLWWPT